jgi:hypothetical protein
MELYDIKKGIRNDVIKFYKELSSGTYSRKFMDDNTPYSANPANRRALPYKNDYRYINKRKGNFYRNWQGIINANGITITNSSKYFNRLEMGIPDLTVRRETLLHPTSISTVEGLVEINILKLVNSIKDILK